MYGIELHARQNMCINIDGHADLRMAKHLL
jgi:hypothetical protein